MGIVNFKQEIEKQKEIVEKACWEEVLSSGIIPFLRHLSRWQFILQKEGIEIKFSLQSNVIWEDLVQGLKKEIESRP